PGVLPTHTIAIPALPAKCCGCSRTGVNHPILPGIVRSAPRRLLFIDPRRFRRMKCVAPCRVAVPQARGYGREHVMPTPIEMEEYLEEIRREVCSWCVERPEGGPPCGPLGKPCGIELHLPGLVKSVREVHSGLIAPYLACNREHICTACPY